MDADLWCSETSAGNQSESRRWTRWTKVTKRKLRSKQQALRNTADVPSGMVVAGEHPVGMSSLIEVTVNSLNGIEEEV